MSAARPTKSQIKAEASAIQIGNQAEQNGHVYDLGLNVQAIMKSCAEHYNYAVIQYALDNDEDYSDCLVDGASRALSALQQNFAVMICQAALVCNGPVAVDGLVRDLVLLFYKEVGDKWKDWDLSEKTASKVWEHLEDRKLTWEVRVTWGDSE